MSPVSSLPLKAIILVFFFIALSQTASVTYVTNATCATETGCDFFSEIWNITGVPSAGDDVIVSSMDHITIYASSADISIQTLAIGSNVTFVLQHSILNITSNNNVSAALQFKSTYPESSFEVRNSTVVTRGSADIDYLVVNDGVLNISQLNAGNAFLSTSSCLGSNWTLGAISISNSHISLFALSVFDLQSNDSVFDIQRTLAVGNSIQVSNGNVTAGYGLYLDNATSANLVNTVAVLPLGIACAGNFTTFSFETTNPTSDILTVGSISCWYEDSNMVKIGDGVTVNLENAFGGNGNIVVGDNVTINVLGKYDYVQIYNITQLSTANPTQINIYGGNLNFKTEQTLVADINVLSGTLQVTSDISILGTISGPGLLSIWNGSLYASNISVQQVESSGYLIKRTIAAKSQFRTSLMECESASNVTIDSPETSIDPPGLYLSLSTLEFTGSYTQIGGFVNFSMANIDSPNAPLLLVHGRAILNGVNFSSQLTPSAVASNPIILVRSLSKELIVTEAQYTNYFTEADWKIVLRDGDLILEYPTSNNKFLDFLNNYKIYIGAIGGAIVVLLVVIVAVVVRRRRAHKYSRIVIK